MRICMKWLQMRNSVASMHGGHFSGLKVIFNHATWYGRAKPILFLGSPCQNKTPHEGIRQCLFLTLEKDRKISIESPLRFVLVKTTCRISLSNLTQRGKLSYLRCQIIEMVSSRASTFCSCISPYNVVLLDQIAATEGMCGGDFCWSTGIVR